MNKLILMLAALLFLSAEVWGESMKNIILPKPKIKGEMSVEEAIKGRRSVRSYAPTEISEEAVSQLLWAAQGITDEARGLRASPSAGALYPLEVYLVKKSGIYRYIPEGHKLELISGKDVKRDLAVAAYNQNFVEKADIDIVICAVYERVMVRYHERATRYTDMEAGHAAQNVFLQAVALGLDSVAVGAFIDEAVSGVLGLPEDVKPLYILPVGYKK